MKTEKKVKFTYLNKIWFYVNRLFHVFLLPQGSFNRLQFFSAIYILYLPLDWLLSYNIFAYVFYAFVGGYSVILSVQKRCRDFNYNGSIFILIFLISVIIYSFTEFLQKYNDVFYKRLMSGNVFLTYFENTLLVLFIVSFLFLSLFPPAKSRQCVKPKISNSIDK